MYVKLSFSSLSEICARFSIYPLPTLDKKSEKKDSGNHEKPQNKKRDLLEQIVRVCPPTADSKNHPLHKALIKRFYEMHIQTLNTLAYYSRGEISKYKFTPNQTDYWCYVSPNKGTVRIHRGGGVSKYIDEYVEILEPDDAIKFRVLYESIFGYKKEVYRMVLQNTGILFDDLYDIVLSKLFLY